MRKNKVGIITYCNAINFGAALQTYALNKYINNLGEDCETINYHCDTIDKSYKLLNFEKYNIKSIVNSFLNLPSNIIRRLKFNRFLKNNVRLSNEKYDSTNIGNSNMIYNKFITGSDQVWNLNLNNDYNYYLSFVSNENSKNSYAASFGNIDILKNNSSKIKECLSDFNVLAVRETSAVIELKSNCSLDAVQVLDPTFLLDKNDWESIITKDIVKGKYILLYVLHEDSAYIVAERLSKLTGMKVCIITQSWRKRIKGIYFRNAGPIEFLSLIANSEYVVTDSFHGTALSIIFQKNLKVVLKQKMLYFNDRLKSIINILGLNDFIVNTDVSDEILLQKIDYSKTNVLLDNNIKDSKRIIEEILR